MAAIDAPDHVDRELSTPMIHRFCISHEKPLLPESWYDDCIALGDFQPDSQFHIRQLDDFWHEARPLAYGAAGTYVLPIAIQRLPSRPQLIEISSHRKRILPSPEGVESRSYGYPSMRELKMDDLERRTEIAVFTPGAGLEFLVAQPVYFEGSILGQYADSHYRRDILDYTSLAIELNVLNSNAASEFLNTHHFISGGVQLGIYPRSWLLETATKIDGVSRQFLSRYRDRLKKYDIYQIRAVGFLSERLGSYLLIRHLMDKYSNKIPAGIFGYMTAIVEGDASYSIAVADRPRRWSSWRPTKGERAQ
ncbi:hypothetical protein [Mycobacterium colombiense]|uniref:hypothetical protein n=1 Tax=Mycobacterium colombiense TaxID=339268 RepID=UPI00200B65D9|nr:hypothetical protein [Mycobacterium colombiense]MCK8643388.1 hypothetical protein [Mycobacterium colombiense]